MRRIPALLMGLFFALPLAATSAAGDDPAAAGLRLDWLDRSVDPTQDFFHFANGGWQKANPIPAAYARWGTFQALAEGNQKEVYGILEDLAKHKDLKSGSEVQKVRDFYASGMDEQAVEKAGDQPLAGELKRIDAVEDAAGLQAEIAHLHMIGVNALFRFGEIQDYKDSTKVIGIAGQGGLGLPDRDYYLKTADKCQSPAAAPVQASAAAAAQAQLDACKSAADRFQKVRDAYVAHVAAMFRLLGDDADRSAAEAKTVMGIETELAQASMPRTDIRDRDKTWHPMDLKALDGTTPAFSWENYFAAVGHPEIKGINLGMPDFFKAANGELTKVPLADWKTYLRWHLMDDYAPYLSKAFVDEDFQMTKALTGAQELLPRWQRVVTEEDRALGFALGRLYVDKEFPPSSKQAVVEMLHGVRTALTTDLKDLSWMSEATRQAAIKKLDLMGERIGYPDKWRDYSSLTISHGPYAANVMASEEFLQKRELDKIGKPVDTNEWSMTPPTVNAYYMPAMNNINFPAGILEPPFFDPKAPPAVNYGAIGAVMGHEMTHGFDDQGARFDPHGNFLTDPGWWTTDDFTKFKAATGCISDHFSAYTVNGDMHVQGKLVTGEATADLGGLTLAWRAFHASKAYKEAKTIDGFTPDQQFFLGFAHVWAMNIRPEESARLVTIDPHPPGVYRVNGTLANMPQFQQAYHVPDGSPMVNKDRCVIW